MRQTCWICAWLLAAVSLALGCHRGYYRRQADAEVYSLIRQKTNDSRWELPDSTIQVNPESRMYDPFSADHPPLPPDDPSSAKLMQAVDDKRGYPHWHANGDTDYVESPEWRAYLPVNPNGSVVIDSKRAVDLALVHSPLYQDQREELYLSALDVSLERFGFDTQMFYGFNSFFSHAGRLNGSGESSSEFELSSGRTELSRLGATGSELVIGFANSILWQFSGPDTQAATSLINFSFIQPLLRGAGRDVILESLTLAERNLLANVRQMERFRQGFFLLITTGRSAGTGPQRGGGFLAAPSQGSGAAAGILGLLRAQQTIRIQEFNVSSLRNVLEQFIEFHKAERLDSLQLSQTESTLYSSESRLMQLRVEYETQLDQFKRTLGLPPDLPVIIQDDFLQPFELIDDENNERQYQIANLKVEVGNVLLEATDHINANRVLIQLPPPAADPAEPDAADAPLRPQELDLVEEYEITWSDELRQRVEAIQPLLDQIYPVIETITTSDVDRVRKDIEYLRQVRPRRTEALARLRALIKSGTTIQYDIQTGILEDTSLENPETLAAELEELLPKLVAIRTTVEQIQNTVRETIESGPDIVPKDLHKRLDEEILSAIPKQLTDLSSVSLELSLVQARARTDSIELPGVDISESDAVQIARCCRLDWMNARASLVDSWRRIEVVADELESQLDLVFEGDISNFGDNPFKLRYEAGQLRAGFRFDSPITRLAERNNYRQTLILYQRSRRDYYAFEDEIKRGLRRTLREIELNKILFELNRRSIKVSVQQVEQSRLKLEEPPPPGATGRSEFGSTTARDLTDALNRLQNDQNSFLDVWTTYESLRRDLNFDLGTMQLTDDGFWIDPGVIDASIGIECGAYRAAAEQPLPEFPLSPQNMPIEIQLEPAAEPEFTPPIVQPSDARRLSGVNDLFIERSAIQLTSATRAPAAQAPKSLLPLPTGASIRLADRPTFAEPLRPAQSNQVLPQTTDSPPPATQVSPPQDGEPGRVGPPVILDEEISQPRDRDLEFPAGTSSRILDSDLR